MVGRPARGRAAGTRISGALRRVVVSVTPPAVGAVFLAARIGHGKALLLIPRQGYFQIAYLGPKGADPQLRARGIEAFRRDVAELVPEAAESVDALTSMDDVKHLDVRINRLRRWHTDGLLCIGDAAHAMSPAGGVGINLAVQDAVAAATLLAGPLRRHRVTARDLAAVRRRRALPTAVTQTMQRVVHRQVVDPILRGEDPPSRRCSAWSIGCRGFRRCQPFSSGWASAPNTPRLLPSADTPRGKWTPAARQMMISAWSCTPSPPTRPLTRPSSRPSPSRRRYRSRRADRCATRSRRSPTTRFCPTAKRRA
ncbi:FAD binding domain protein [Mycobacterium xenopi 4042]|uniref:FAD binding domain protein n=1 Tax=Mycobacterium xenopi 4042 TaxID=1299334 RepID=X8AN36_MYCXE|nr:FAD binding domain protein [Mycobacterium xenopi 4042]